MEDKQKLMPGVIAAVWVIVCLGFITGFAAQLPPEILVDKYLLQATILSEEKDHKGALEAMNKIVALQKKHDLTLPEAFSFQYAQTALAAGLGAGRDCLGKPVLVDGREAGQALPGSAGVTGEGRAQAAGACCRPGRFHAGEAGSRTTTPGNAAILDADPKDY